MQNHNSKFKSNLDKLTEKIIGLAIKVHKKLGPGFVERIYQRALYLEFKNNKLHFEREKKIPVYYNKALLGYEQVDFIVQSLVIVELKCVNEISNIHKAQLLSYIKAANAPIGLILNFAKPTIEIKRLIHTTSASTATTEPRKSNRITENTSVSLNNSASQRLQGRYSLQGESHENGKTATTEPQNNLETQKEPKTATTEPQNNLETQKEPKTATTEPQNNLETQRIINNKFHKQDD